MGVALERRPDCKKIRCRMDALCPPELLAAGYSSEASV